MNQFATFFSRRWSCTHFQNFSFESLFLVKSHPELIHFSCYWLLFFLSTSFFENRIKFLYWTRFRFYFSHVSVYVRWIKPSLITASNALLEDWYKVYLLTTFPKQTHLSFSSSHKTFSLEGGGEVRSSKKFEQGMEPFHLDFSFSLFKQAFLDWSSFWYKCKDIYKPSTKKVTSRQGKETFSLILYRVSFN